jgi:hypothetical protein
MPHIPLDLLPDHHLPRLITVDTRRLAVCRNLTSIAHPLSHENPISVVSRLRMRWRVLLLKHLRATSCDVVCGAVPRPQLRHVVGDGVAAGAAVAAAVSAAVAVAAFGGGDATESGV